jgi:hypothetical protein
VTLSGPRERRLLHFSGIVKLWWSPGKAGGYLKEIILTFFLIQFQGVTIKTEQTLSCKAPSPMVLWSRSKPERESA